MTTPLDDYHVTSTVLDTELVGNPFFSTLVPGARRKRPGETRSEPGEAHPYHSLYAVHVDVRNVAADSERIVTKQFYCT